MSDIAQFQFRAYQETAEHYAARMLREGVAEAPKMPDPAATARQQLALAVSNAGLVLDHASIRSVDSQAIVRADSGDWRPAAPGEAPTGHIVTWTCSASPRVGTDAEDPILHVIPDADSGTYVATLPESLTLHGGSCRVRHDRGTGVTVRAENADGDPVVYLFASELDPNTVHVETFPGATRLRIVED